jgi:hypothetical protein
MIAMRPIAPVLLTCVPPHAERSTPSISTSLNVPSRSDSFRSDSFAASSELAKRIDTLRFSQMTRLASVSAAAISVRESSRATSIVDASLPR